MSNYKTEGWQKGKKATPTNFSKFDFFFCMESMLNKLALKWQTWEFGLLLFSWKTLLTFSINQNEKY